MKSRALRTLFLLVLGSFGVSCTLFEKVVETRIIEGRVSDLENPQNYTAITAWSESSINPDGSFSVEVPVDWQIPLILISSPDGDSLRRVAYAIPNKFGEVIVNDTSTADALILMALCLPFQSPDEIEEATEKLHKAPSYAGLINLIKQDQDGLNGQDTLIGIRIGSVIKEVVSGKDQTSKDRKKGTALTSDKDLFNRELTYWTQGNTLTVSNGRRSYFGIKITKLDQNPPEVVETSMVEPASAVYSFPLNLDLEPWVKDYHLEPGRYELLITKKHDSQYDSKLGTDATLRNASLLVVSALLLGVDFLTLGYASQFLELAKCLEGTLLFLLNLADAIRIAFADPDKVLEEVALWIADHILTIAEAIYLCGGSEAPKWIPLIGNIISIFSNIPEDALNFTTWVDATYSPHEYIDTLIIGAGGACAYVADGDAGLRVIDISNPSNPHEVGYWDRPGWARGVFVK